MSLSSESSSIVSLKQTKTKIINFIHDKEKEDKIHAFDKSKLLINPVKPF